MMPLKFNPNLPLTLVLTLGDATGIGPEITARFLATIEADPRFQRGELGFRILGDLDALHQAAHQLQITLPKSSSQLQYIHIAGDTLETLPIGAVAVKALTEAVRLIHRGEAQALVTAPISKAHLAEAGYVYTGHTEILQDLAHQFWPKSETSQPWQSDMLFEFQNFRVVLLTRHIALSQISVVLSVETATQTLRQTVDFLKHQAGIHHPRMAVLGVNPHAGEVGGDEEALVLIPAMAKIRNEGGVMLEGPLPADAAFRGLNPKLPAYDVYVAPYHDQGLIPMKLLAGYQAVNVTIGLPFIRTSVSHGTAPDIVGLGIADPQSLFAAVESAIRLVKTAVFTDSATKPLEVI